MFETLFDNKKLFAIVEFYEISKLSLNQCKISDTMLLDENSLEGSRNTPKELEKTIFPSKMIQRVESRCGFESVAMILCLVDASCRRNVVTVAKFRSDFHVHLHRASL